MASGFFALLDDIAVLMDDVAVLGKIAGKKTAGILGDDLAVNAEKASGFVSSRELPVLWAITKGSFVNKLIILPLAFLLSAFFPAAVIVILVLGGLYLAYEGAEKIYEFFFPHAPEGPAPKLEEISEEDGGFDVADEPIPRGVRQTWLVIALLAHEGGDAGERVLVVGQPGLQPPHDACRVTLELRMSEARFVGAHVMPGAHRQHE